MKIALSAICFHQALFSSQMVQAEVPAAAAALGFDAVELLDLLAVPLPFGRWTGRVRRLWYLLHDHLPVMPERPTPPPKAYEPAEVAPPLRDAAEAARCRVIAWTLDSDLTAQGAALVAQRAYWAKGIATARALGAEVLRVTTGGRAGDPAALPQAQAALATLVEMAAGLRVAVETHGGLSQDPAQLVALLAAVPGAGCCLDWGNLAPAQRTDGVRCLVPYTVHVHAKSYAFNARGHERTLDLPSYLAALRQVGYDGWFSIEYEGHGPPAEGILQTRVLLETLWQGKIN